MEGKVKTVEEKHDIKTTVVTAGDRAFAWGAMLLVASIAWNLPASERRAQLSAMSSMTLRTCSGLPVPSVPAYWERGR